MWICYNDSMKHNNEQLQRPENETYRQAEQLAAHQAELILKYYQEQDNEKRDALARQLVAIFNTN